MSSPGTGIEEFFRRFTVLTVVGEATSSAIAELARPYGITYRPDLVVRPDRDTIAAFSAALDAPISSARQGSLADLPADDTILDPAPPGCHARTASACGRQRHGRSASGFAVRCR